MIIPKRDAKYYGAVHIDNYLTFTGFCKKVDSDEICDVDVFLDGKKIDTLKADKKIGKVEDIYDIEGHGFEFELSDEYFEKSHLLEFKASTGEELVNSKIQTIDKKHPKFNEYRFLHSVLKFNSVEIENLYKQNVIGFFATNENLINVNFMNYVLTFLEKFNVTVTVFFFKNDNKAICKNILADYLDRVIFISPQNLTDLVSNVEIILCNEMEIFDKLILNKTVSIYANKVFVLYIWLSHSKLTLIEYNKILEGTNHPIFEDKFYNSFGLRNNYDKNNSLVAIERLSNIIRFDYRENDLVEDIFYYKFIELILMNNSYIKNLFNKIHGLVYA